MKHITRIAFLASLAMLQFLVPSRGLGLAARFGDVIVENVEIGKTYNLREALKIPLGIENRSTGEVEVVIEIEQAEQRYLKAPYESIPDPNWITAIPERIKIPASGIGFFDLILTVPDDKSLVGRHFTAIVKARTQGTGLLGVGIENKLRFSIGPGPASLQEEKRQKAMSRLEFDVSPRNLYLVDVPVGKKFDAKKDQNKSIRVANYSSDPLDIKLSTAAWESKNALPPGYEPIPDPNWVTFKNSSAHIAGEEIASFQPVVQIPDDPKHRGKKYAVLIRTGLTTGFWLDAPVKLYIAVKE